MRKIAFILVTLNLMCISILAQTGRESRPKALALTHVFVIDATSATAKSDMTVVIAGDRITEIGKSGKVKIPRGARIVKATGKYLIPGLWDMHMHLSWTTASALPLLIANGVTGVRDMGGRLGEIDEWRTKIAGGLLVGPRIVRAGPQLNGQKFNPYQIVAANPDETRGVVRALKEAGVDFIKVHRRLSRDCYFAAIDEAKRQGLTLVGHIPMTVTPEEASDAGQATIEHVETLFEGTFSAALKGQKLSEAVRRWRAEEADKLFTRFVKNHTVVTPTLAAWRWFVTFSDPSLPPDPRSRYVALSVKKAFPRPSKTPAEELTELKQRFAEFREVVRQMNRSGVTLIAGTDTAVTAPGFTLHDELAVLVEAGLTPLQALQAATLTPAKVLNKANDFGTIENGKIADLVLLDGNPLEDIRNTQRIHAVIFNGKLLDRAALDRLLAEGERAAQKN
jgi:imidazolonepropionase-like amidohydrolase